MSKVKANYLTEGLSGKHGNKVVFRQWHGQTIMAKSPGKRKSLTPGQEAAKERFLDAVDYAGPALMVPETREFYKSIAPAGRSAYNMAVADFLSIPKIVRIDAGGYQGEPGNLIAVTAIDKCCVKRVVVTIRDAGNQVIESGEATLSAAGRTWQYAATTSNPQPAGCRVEVCVSDMPNHLVTGSVTIN